MRGSNLYYPPTRLTKGGDLTAAFPTIARPPSPPHFVGGRCAGEQAERSRRCAPAPSGPSSTVSDALPPVSAAGGKAAGPAAFAKTIAS
jgi:hypothetical protein